MSGAESWTRRWGMRERRYRISRDTRAAPASAPERWRLAGWPGARPAAVVAHECHALARVAYASRRTDPQMTQMYARALGLPAPSDLSRLKAVDQRPPHCSDQLLGGAAMILTRSFVSSPRRDRKHAFNAVTCSTRITVSTWSSETNECLLRSTSVGWSCS